MRKLHRVTSRFYQRLSPEEFTHRLASLSPRNYADDYSDVVRVENMNWHFTHDAEWQVSYAHEAPRDPFRKHDWSWEKDGWRRAPWV